MLSSDTSRLRPKPQLSCLPCRRNKVKCNRGHPCTRCLSRGLADSCSYKSARGDDDSRVRPTPEATAAPMRPSTMSDMRSCINELEMLVRSLKRPSRSGNLTSAGTTAGGEEDPRWAAALERISQLRVLLDRHSTITHEESDAMLPPAEALPALQPPAPVAKPEETAHGAAEAAQSAKPRRHPNPYWRMYFFVPEAFGTETSAALPVGTGMSAG